MDYNQPNKINIGIKKNRFEHHPIVTLICFILILILVFDFLAAEIIIGKDNSEKFRTRNIFYHHDLRKNINEMTHWGNVSYKMITNSLGFKDSSNRIITLSTSKKRILYIGDSFTEGMGMPYEKTFAGILNSKIDHDKIEILNAAVISYSPKLYYLKLKFLIEKVGLKIDEVYVFIDISDIQDEIRYEYFEPPMLPKETDVPLRRFLMRHSVIANLINKMRIAVLIRFRKPLNKFFGPESLFTSRAFEIEDWTMDEDILNEWGKRGLALAAKNMQNLVDLCRKHNILLAAIAVYPWPEHIRSRQLHCLQESFWDDFAKKNNIRFIDYFPDFINNIPPEQVISKYFIRGDIHWNEEGHRLIASRIKLF